MQFATKPSGPGDGRDFEVDGAARKSTPPPSSRSAPSSVRPREGAEAPRYFEKLASRSAASRQVRAMVDRFAVTDVTVTLTGETGVGKDVIAHAIHERSLRAGRPFIVFDCGAIAPNLAESELFGHERGAFTGAVTTHPGAFERACGGTIFLDEVAEMPLDLQTRLLRALESRCVRRVGGRADRAIDVRVLAATNRDLRAEVAAGRFREDLLFRLAVAVVHVPPLRERLDDLPDIVTAVLADFGRPDVVVTDAALALLRTHAWPGNVRELKNTVNCALAFLDANVSVLEPHHFTLFGASQPSNASALDALPLGGRPLEDLERAAIRQTLAQLDGNKVAAARTLGIALSTLYKKLKQYEMEP